MTAPLERVTQAPDLQGMKSLESSNDFADPCCFCIAEADTRTRHAGFATCDLRDAF
jgi:hypothetical protein